MWEINGISGRGLPPPVAGTYHGAALVMGSGRCLWHDLFAVLPQYSNVELMDVVAINDMILHYPGKVKHGVSLHRELPELFRRARETESEHAIGEIATHAMTLDERHSADYIWGIIEGAMGGTSALFAVMVALALGYEKVVLAGVPLDASGRLFDPPAVNKRYDGHILAEWNNAKQNYFKDRVRALSGNAVAILGAFDQVWLHG